MSNKGTFQPAFNSDINTWNVPVNANTQNFDDALGTVQTFALTSVSGTIAVTGTSFVGAYPANTASYIPLIFSCSGIPTGAVTLQIPASIGGNWIVNNQCTGVFSTVTIASGGAGSTVNVPGGTSATVYSDGTNIGSTSTLLNASTSLNDNRIINGDMRIDQRNGGASGTATGYTIDRWAYSASQAAKGTWQRSSGPGSLGFPYCLGVFTSSAYTSLAADNFDFSQAIEADFISDFAWGTSAAEPVTLSFWAFSSLSGTFSGSIRNYAGTRSYPFSFSLPTPSTWTKIAITIPGDTGGTWVMSGSGGGASVSFDLGSGTSFRGTAGAWVSANYVGVTGAVSVIATNAATFYVTGVKLEIGSVATTFPQDSLAKRMADCQRYYNNAIFVVMGGPNQTSGGTLWAPITFPSMRVAPTATTTGLAYSNMNSLSLGNITLNNLVAVSLWSTFGNGTTSFTLQLSAEL